MADSTESPNPTVPAAANEVVPASESSSGDPTAHVASQQETHQSRPGGADFGAMLPVGYGGYS